VISREGEERRSLWRSQPFLRFWTGNAVSSFGDQITALALPLIAVTEFKATPFQVGVLTAALWGPNLLGVLIGTWADAVRQQRWLLVLANVLQATALAVVPVAFVTGTLSISLLWVAAVALGFGGVLFDSAYPTLFVRLVRRDQYVSANSALSTTRGMAAIGGPAVGGGLIQLLGAPLAILADAVSFLVSALAIASVRTPPRPRERASTEPFLRRLHLGVSYLRQHQILRASLFASATMNIASLAIQALLVLYATRYLHLNAGQIGLALGIGAAGGLLGALTAGPLADRIGSGPAIAIGVALSALPFITLPVAAETQLNPFIALSAAEFVSSWAIMVFDVNNNSLRAAITDDDMRSRVAGAYSTINYGVRPLGAVLAGIAATVAGPGLVIGAAAVLGAVAVAWVLPSPILRVQRIADLEQTESDMS
jgi:MFS family permease